MSRPRALSLVPLVPIVPDLRKEIHRQWRSYGGFTFAFSDYTDVNFTTHLDDPDFLKGLAYVDPINYLPRLSRIPKFVVLSSDDEFAQFDWTDIWWDAARSARRSFHRRGKRRRYQLYVLELHFRR